MGINTYFLKKNYVFLLRVQANGGSWRFDPSLVISFCQEGRDINSPSSNDLNGRSDLRCRILLEGVAISPGREGLAQVLVALVHGDDEHFHSRIYVFDGPGHFEAALRYSDIEDDHVGNELLQQS